MTEPAKLAKPRKIIRTYYDVDGGPAYPEPKKRPSWRLDRVLERHDDA